MPDRLEQLIDDALLPLYGDNLAQAKEECWQHDRALREIPVQLEAEHDHEAAQVLQEGHEGYETTERLRELRVRYVNRIRDALVAQWERHRKNLEALQVKPEESAQDAPGGEQNGTNREE